MALTQAQKDLRKGKITGSAIGTLMEGDEAEILNLYYEITEDPRYVPKKLDDVWPVQLGSHTEIFSLHWYARTMGYGPLVKKATVTTDEGGNLVISDIELYKDNPVKKLGDMVTHPKYPWAAATLDGFDTAVGSGIVIECKHCGAYRKMPDILAKYAPQLHWQMFVTGTKRITLRVILGANEPTNIFIEFDEFYWSTLWSRALTFMERVHNKKPPSDNAVAAPVAQAMVEKVMRTFNFKQMESEGEVLPNWGPDIISHSLVWLDSVDAMKAGATAADKIKELLPSDVGHLIMEGVVIKRNKAGAVSINKE